MISLRQKFLFGGGSLVAILFFSTLVGVTVAWRANRAVQVILKNNYDTLVFCQGWYSDCSRLDKAARSLIQGKNSGDWDNAEADFERNLRLEQGNITEPGEREMVGVLSGQWESYKTLLDEFRRKVGSGRRAFYGARVEPLELELLGTCHSIAKVNVAAMPGLSERARRLAREAAQWGVSLLALATLLVSAGLILLGRWVINPIRAVTESAREIAGGNLDMVVASSSQDEVGELAASFNQMAGSLREFRRGDRQRLIQFQSSVQRTLDALIDGVAFLDVAGHVQLSNPVAQRLFGLKSEQVPGPACPSDLIELLNRCRRDGTGFTPEGYKGILQVFDQGRELFFLPRIEAVNGEDGRLAGLALVLVNVTGLRRMDELKSGVVATVSHELKTPLTGLRMALHLLLNERTGPLNPQQEELALAARQEAERLHGIMINLLDIGRLESGQSGLALKAQSAVDLAREAVEQQRAAYQSKGVDLREEENAPADAAVSVDSARLRHVFSNLLDNALKHTPPGGAVVVRVESDPSEVRFSVRDSGAGIAPEHLPHLFDKFFRVPGQSVGGAGLGLAIAREIVVAHGGTMQVRSDPGRGSTFLFSLPRSTARP